MGTPKRFPLDDRVGAGGGIECPLGVMAWTRITRLDVCEAQAG